jgi:hypothetical protein
VHIEIPRLRLVRTGIIVLLAALVVLLGAAAKHSQFDSPPHSGYLSKAVKMAGARVLPDTPLDVSGTIASPVAVVPQVTSEEPLYSALPASCYTPVSLSNPPLRA